MHLRVIYIIQKYNKHYDIRIIKIDFFYLILFIKILSSIHLYIHTYIYIYIYIKQIFIKIVLVPYLGKIIIFFVIQYVPWQAMAQSASLLD